MGLGSLRLDERLSEAAGQHSDEMKKMGYFAHESPVSENKEPGMRAANEEFEGQFRGENIFFSSAGASSVDAYRAWWKSDGHRFGMYDDRPDAIGVGLSSGATHWTTMTGVKSG